MHKSQDRVFLEKSTSLRELLSVRRLLIVNIENALFNADASRKAVFPKLKTFLNLK